jgi:hypothetical protein
METKMSDHRDDPASGLVGCVAFFIAGAILVTIGMGIALLLIAAWIELT